MIDLDRLIRLMAEFETGLGDFGPLDLTNRGEEAADPEVEGQLAGAVLAFCESTARDTAKAGGEDPDQFAQAGFLQGLCVGYAYAKEES